MPALTVIYSRSHTVGGLLIRVREPFGRWSHCGIVTPEGTAIEALAGRGVVEVSIHKFEQRYPRPSQRAVVRIECPDPDAAVAWARSQVGKAYDYLGVLGLAVREQWGHRDRWHCAELVEAALAHAGRRRFRDAPHFISPNLSYMVT